MYDFYDTLFPYALGVLLALTAIYPARALEPRQERRFFTVIMIVVAFGFIGFPLADGDATGVFYELAALATFAVLIALSIFASPAFLAVTFFAHGTWDLAHLLGFIPVDKPVGVVELCVPYDWLVAGYVAWRSRA